jgi:CubicO group peptidase (beta-lactamase class C family)
VSTLLDERVFRPLGMRAFVGPAPSDITLAEGHTSTGTTTAHWTFPPALSGFGGVRASLDDMILLAQAALDPDAFWQIHRSVVVRAAAIDHVRRDADGKRWLALRGRRETFPVSSTYQTRFRGM